MGLFSKKRLVYVRRESIYIHAETDLGAKTVASDEVQVGYSGNTAGGFSQDD